MTALLIICIVFCGVMVVIDVAAMAASSNSDEQSACLVNMVVVLFAIVTMSIALGVQ